MTGLVFFFLNYYVEKGILTSNWCSYANSWHVLWIGNCILQNFWLQWKLFWFSFSSIVFLNLVEREKEKKIQWGPVLLHLVRHQLCFLYLSLILKAKITRYSTIIIHTTLIKWNNFCNVCIIVSVILVNGVETWKPSSPYTVHTAPPTSFCFFKWLPYI